MPTRRTVLAGLASVPLAARAKSDLPRLGVRFADQDFTYRLFDNPTTRDLVSMLPANLQIEDFSNNEKIAHLPRRLSEDGLRDFDDETPGDLCLFLGWGNLAFFYDSYHYRGDLIRLGHIEGALDPLLVRGKYPLRLVLKT